MSERLTRPTPHRVSVHDQNGHIVGTVDATRARWKGWLLAECPQDHIFIIHDDGADECPVCHPRTDERQVR